MRIATISSKRQITLAQSLLEKYQLYPLNKVFIEETKEGLIMKPLKKSIIEETFGFFSSYIDKDKKGLSCKKIIKETKKLISKKLTE